MFKQLAIAALLGLASTTRVTQLKQSVVQSQLAQTKQAPSWEEIISIVDKNGDNEVQWQELADLFNDNGIELSADEWDQLQQVFDLIDADGSGAITKAEFDDAMAKYGLGQKVRKALAQNKTKAASKSKQGPPSWEDILEELDTDMSGTISYGELKSYIEALEVEHDFELSEDDWAQVEQVFDFIDADGSGEVDEAEFAAAMEGAGLAQVHWARAKVMKKMNAKKH